MRIVIAWIVGSMLIGYLGRKRRAGFWGNFFFSMLVSPIVGALALLLAGPSGQQKDQTRRAVRAAASRKAAVVRPAGINTIASTFLFPWLGLLLLFSVIYAITLQGALDAAGLRRGFELSLDMATLGLTGVSASGAAGGTRILMNLERLGVLLILATAIVRVVGSTADRRVRQLRTSMDEAVSALEASNRSQREELERLRAVVAHAPARAVDAAATTSATVSH
jgi:hypothetical protein